VLIVIVIVCACCNLPAWPTFVWQAVGHDCGTVQLGLGKSGAPSPSQAETCLAQAYQHCSAARLTATDQEVDSSSSNTFVIEPYGFTCAIGLLWHSGGRIALSGVGYCSSLHQDADGSLRVLGCQYVGNVTMPST
jgi:hypothetical protein